MRNRPRYIHALRAWVLLLVVVFTLPAYFLLTGCETSPSEPPVTTIERYYGPPFGDITFIDSQSFVGTLPDVPGDRPAYLMNIGEVGS